jgi:hypothetical protein
MLLDLIKNMLKGSPEVIKKSDVEKILDLTFKGLKEDVLPVFQELAKLKPEAFNNLDKETKTTVGRALVNKLLISDPFNNKIPFTNSEISIGKMENIIAKGLSDKSILVSEYKIWMEHVTYISMISQ